MAANCEHKVRGGSALSAALSKASPGLMKNSPSDSVDSTLASLTSSYGGSPWHSLPTPGSAPHAGAMPVAAAAGTITQAHKQRHRPMLPFLSCFGMSGSYNEEHDTQQQTAVSASEVGIRPCFYWLEAPLSEEDRMFAEANARWLKSDCQDDAVVIDNFCGLSHQTFAGVFDGHGPYGRTAAKFASTRLPQLLAAKLATAGNSERKRLRCMREACLEVNTAMQNIVETGFDASLSGTTACCVLLVGRKVLVASAGDSRCVVARRAANGEMEVVPLTWDAKPMIPEEERRIAMAGGVVKQLLDERGQRVGAYRVFSRGDDVLPGLAMSRSLGDLYAHAVGVTPEPVLNTYTLGERDLFLMLATDGLWDIMQNEEAADFVERYKTRRDVHVSCAEALTLEAQERWKALHDEAIVDDISCVILHTSVLPPPECDNSLPHPLARAAACNDEANELYAQWKVEKERNPSNHKPRQYFKHLYNEEGGNVGGEEAGAAGTAVMNERQHAAAVAAAAQAAQAAAGQAAGGSGAQTGATTDPVAAAAAAAATAAAAAGCAPITPPAEEALLRMGVPPPASPQAARVRTAALASPPSPSPPAFGAGGHMRDSSGTLNRMDDISSSPRSSYDLPSDASEPSIRRGSAFEGAFYATSGSIPELSSPMSLARRSGARPIPMMTRRDSLSSPACSAPLESLLRPVRKAYPSNSNMLDSYRSDASLYAADTPRSGDGSFLMERKVHGGMSRSLTAPRALASMSMSGASMGRAGADYYGGGSSGRRASIHVDERMLGCSSPSSPGGESLLASPLSPHLSPVVVPLGGYSRVSAAAAGSLAVRADMVQQGTYLSRTATDSAGIATAMAALAAESGVERSHGSSTAAALAASIAEGGSGHAARRH